MTTKVRLTYYDTAMTLIEIGGVRLLTDPVLDPEGTVIDDGPVRLVKSAAAPVTAEALGLIDAALLSHDQHGDNLDRGGRALLADLPLVLTTPVAAGRLGGNARGLDPWQSTLLAGGVRITAVPAQHAPEGLHEITGPVTGFVIELADGSARPLYISGDTIRFSGTEEIARRYAPVGLAILHLGRAQVEPLGEVSLSLSADEAAHYADELEAEVVVPIHFEGWKHFTEGRTDAAEVFARRGLDGRTCWLERGGAVEIELARPDAARSAGTDR